MFIDRVRRFNIGAAFRSSVLPVVKTVHGINCLDTYTFTFPPTTNELSYSSNHLLSLACKVLLTLAQRLRDGQDLFNVVLVILRKVAQHFAFTSNCVAGKIF
jgi:hypothetical protein